MPELTLWPRSARGRPESEEETESDRNIADFLATAKPSKIIPQRWSTTPSSRARGATSRVSVNLPRQQTLLPNSTGSSSPFPSHPRQPQIPGVAVPVPVPEATSEYLAEAPGPDIINTDPGARNQKSAFHESSTYAPLASRTSLHQKSFPEVDRPSTNCREISVGGRTYGFMFPSHEYIIKPHIEVEGDTPRRNNVTVEHTSLSASVNTPPELPASTTLPSEPLPSSAAANCHRNSDGFGEPIGLVSSDSSNNMDSAPNRLVQNSESHRGDHGHNSTGPAVCSRFQDEKNQSLFSSPSPQTSDGNAQLQGHPAARTFDQEIEHQIPAPSNIQPSPMPPWAPDVLVQPFSALSTHMSGEKNVSSDTRSQHPPVTSPLEGQPNPNSRFDRVVLEDPRSSGGNPLHVSQAFEANKTSNSRACPPRRQVPETTEIRIPMVLSDTAPRMSMPISDASGLVHDQFSQERSSEANFNRPREVFQPPEQRQTFSSSSESAPKKAPTQSTNRSGQSSMHSPAQPRVAGTFVLMQDSRHSPRSTAQPENGRVVQIQPPTNPRRDILPPPMDSPWNANAFPETEILQDIGPPPKNSVPASKQSQKVLTKTQRTADSSSKDSGTGVKNWKVVKKMTNLVTGGGSTPITYSPEEMTRRCLQFMDQQGIPADPGLDPFSAILVYARAKWKQDEAQIQEQAVMINNLTERKGSLKGQLDSTQNQLRLVIMHRDELRSDINTTKEKLESSEECLRGFQASFNEQLDYNKQLTHRLQGVEEENVRLFQEGQKRIQEVRDWNSRTILAKNQELNSVKASLQAQITELQKRIASYGEIGFRFVTDDKFRDKMQVVEQIISKLVNYVTRPPSQNFDRDLDPTAFLQRNHHRLGNRIWREYIFGICWEALQRGFFSSPLGFGIFGPAGDGFSLLNHIHQILTLHDATTNKFGIVNDKPTNEVRGFLFGRIWDDVISGSTSPEKQSNAGSAKGLSVYFNQRVDVVTDDLISILSRCSGNNLDSRAPAEIRDLVRHVGLLGLEMATQRSHLTLEFRAYGEPVQQGPLFVDETVGEGASGAAWVDLLTEPALTRLGNGRNDFTEYKVLRPGTFVALRN